jgi:hypothetical protein
MQQKEQEKQISRQRGRDEEMKEKTLPEKQALALELD